jgi:mono/diheme cytochrome c family protein
MDPDPLYSPPKSCLRRTGKKTNLSLSGCLNLAFLGEKRMKNLMNAVLTVLAFTLVFSTWSLADGGADTFKAKCAMCHGADGKGDTSMGKTMKVRDLGSADVQSQSDADLTAIITNGKGKMPKYDGKLTADQIKDVVKYIRTLKH